ncbi:S41 family peptidase [Bdellovibrio svalbardensis]|uniref:S41 family peptidase n=1 Tax=Bdellovibrio svalbardensis TaxID=2972972 RepID=A0ABT6DI20_9BACT|nr:S41 family peptidase [Bdellovibrio svalbardensis]MDG0816495.1 S41 family peptidase [Bdellovibrio svalbardensis]
MITIFVLCSCQTKPKKWTSDDLIISDQVSLNFAEKLSANQAAEDIDFLIFALSNGYGGRKYVPGDSFSKAITALKDISKQATMAEFHDRIDESLFIIPDNHMAAYYMGNVSKKRSEQKQLDVGHVGANNIKDPNKFWETRIDRVGKKKVLYISITEFPDRQSEEWTGFIPSASALKKNADAIVIDLRGNIGGDDTKGMELAQLLFGHPFEHPISKQYRSQTAETLALAVTKNKVQIINKKIQKLQIPPYLENGLDNTKEQYNLALSGQLPPEYIRTDKGGGKRSDPVTGFKKPIYILMDRACSSSCEFTIAAFEWNKYVTKVGENTNGTFHFSNAGMVVLPNSKIKVSIPTQYSEYYDHRFIERIGLKPEIKVSEGDDAYEVTKKVLNGQKSGPFSSSLENHE